MRRKRSVRVSLLTGWLAALCVGVFQLAAASQSALPNSQLPVSQVHPLPPTLAAWTAPAGQPTGDYFEAVQPTEFGYLIWSKFPVQVYIQPAESDAKSQAWVEAVSQAVQEWAIYLPLAVITDPEAAEIKVLRTAPPLQALRPTAESSLTLPRIQAAETHYQVFRQQDRDSSQLAQRFTIQLSPSQTADYSLATARHELGHALGIWGHSPLQTDALYFSQVRHPGGISARDISTLKRVYQQPTQLGWPL